ncbi:serine/threonine protein kinase [Pendulispora albinea]|uniref:non-specific serine/threonine protein kinase n=2 Tax=Pendulispora albinea TaxID=2741071 RepID=A0ABZ2LRD7_9BACT
MGIVEAAIQHGPGERVRIVAFKRLLPEASREKRHRDMFLREARLATMLEHPNVVRALDCGQLKGEVFIAMEFVEGETLSSLFDVLRAKGHRVHPAVAAHILALVCDGLHAAHELCDANGVKLNLVHRDVSPHNVMIARDGEVKLLDFGVAKIDASDVLTRTGEVKGKAAYMSPEQVMSDPLDRRSDLYSVGALLFECIAGRKMWEGSEMEVIRALTQGQAPSLAEWAPDAPQELCQLHARLVARSPENRPPSARHVADELRAYVGTSGVMPDQWMLEQSLFGLFAGEAHRRREALRSAVANADLPDLLKQRLIEQVIFTQSGVHTRSYHPPAPPQVVMPDDTAQTVAAGPITDPIPPPMVPPEPPSRSLAANPEAAPQASQASQAGQASQASQQQAPARPPQVSTIQETRRYAMLGIALVVLAVAIVLLYCLSMLYLRR